MRKRILILEQQSWFGGAQRVLEIVMSSLANDFEPLVMFPDDGEFSAALRARGIRTATFPLGIYRPGRKSLSEKLVFAVRSMVCTVKVASFIRKNQIAVVYVNGPRCLPAGALAAWLTHRPSVFHLHLVLQRRLERRIVTRLARHVSKIVACSKAAAESLLNDDPTLASRISVLYNPVAERFAEHEKDQAAPRSDPDAVGDITFGIVGRITPIKGHELVFRALNRLRTDLRNKVHLIVVGAPAPGCSEDIQYQKRLKDYANRHGLSERVWWTGFQTDVHPFIARMDALLQPCFNEALSLTILEALQEGVPVIAAATGGVPEIVRHECNGLLVRPNDEAELVHALESFLEDPLLRNRLIAGASVGLDSRFSTESFRPAIRGLIQTEVRGAPA